MIVDDYHNVAACRQAVHDFRSNRGDAKGGVSSLAAPANATVLAVLDSNRISGWPLRSRRARE